jgi:murein DD-endopeptidase MepM/ murein hydrolase activator NlpD
VAGRSIIRPLDARGFAAALVLAFAMIGNGCATPAASSRPLSYRGSYATATHVVEPGETIYHIALEYGVSSERLMAANDLDDPRELRVGQTLQIPGVHSLASEPEYEHHDFWSVPRAERQFAWPVTAGQVSSPFGIRHGVMHNGVDIAAPVGTPILAADPGYVLFAGRLRGYGNVVILQHSGGYMTVYGHNERNLVREGDRVSRGEEIAELGQTGRASGPNLHFEVRYRNQPQNPLAYLPLPPSGGSISFARNGGY